MTLWIKLKAYLAKCSWRFWIIFGYAAVVIVFCAFWGWSLVGPLNSAIIQEQTDSLVAIARAGALTLEESAKDPEAIAEELTADTDLRATIISLDGTVVGESTRLATQLENHRDRPEVQAALNGEVGTDIRLSTTTNEQELYVAVPAKTNTESVILRVSSTLVSIKSVQNNAQSSGLILLGLGIVIACAIAWRTYESATSPVMQLEKVRTDFVANASHELKTPVAGIRLLSEAIDASSAEGDIDTTRMFSARLRHEAERLQHLVTDLLDLSRLEEGSNNSQDRTDVRAAVSTSFEAHRALAQHKGLTFSFYDTSSASSDTYAQMEASDASLIIDNLLDNAIQYTEKGSVSVHFDIEGPQLKLQVKDTGIGIPTAEQSRIFERFYRVDTARSREAGGTGLGLSLVRHAVKRGGGSIQVNSMPGEGSTFIVFLPRA